jgi:hypothetical protein
MTLLALRTAKDFSATNVHLERSGQHISDAVDETSSQVDN